MWRPGGDTKCILLLQAPLARKRSAPVSQRRAASVLLVLQYHSYATTSLEPGEYCSTLESNPKQITLYRKTQSLSRLQLNLIPEE